MNYVEMHIIIKVRLVVSANTLINNITDGTLINL